MNTITEWVSILANVFSVFIAETPFAAVGQAVLCAIGTTQFFKMAVIKSNIPNGPWHFWYGITVITSIVVTRLLWPTGNSYTVKQAFVWGVICGTLLAPFGYLLGTRLLYKYFPQLEAKISATPKGV